MANMRVVAGTFQQVPGGFSRKISDNITEFIPDFCTANFDESTGQLSMYCPDYEALEAQKQPAQVAEDPGVYSYCDEMQKAPIGCDFSADLSYYGKHYFLRPLRDGLPRLKGRGITYNEKDNDYTVTERAYEKLKAEYKISYKYYLD